MGARMSDKDIGELLLERFGELTDAVLPTLENLQTWIARQEKKSAHNRWLLLGVAGLGCAMVLTAQLWILAEAQTLVLSNETQGRQMNHLLELIESKSEDEEVLEQVKTIKGYQKEKKENDSEPSW